MFNKRDQKADESVEDYAAALRILATTCNFCECMGDSLLRVRDRIILWIKDSSTRKRLLQEGDLTLKACNSCIDMCRAAEATSQELRSFKLADETSAEACSVSTRDGDRKSAQSKTMQCRYCGQLHKFKKELLRVGQGLQDLSEKKSFHHQVYAEATEEQSPPSRKRL